MHSPLVKLRVNENQEKYKYHRMIWRSTRWNSIKHDESIKKKYTVLWYAKYRFLFCLRTGVSFEKKLHNNNYYIMIIFTILMNLPRSRSLPVMWSLWQRVSVNAIYISKSCSNTYLKKSTFFCYRDLLMLNSTR